MTDETVATDVLGAPYTAETIELPADDEGAVVATLVKRPADSPTASDSDRAVLHVHGFADYFFQAEYAEWWTARGYDFYALDLRKHGRSIRGHQTPNYVDDLRAYFPDLDAAWSRITDRDGHGRVVVSAHSTGGLITSLWADARRPAELAGLALNSPWFDLHAPFLMRTAGTFMLNQFAARRPRQEVPRNVTGLYTRSLHRDHDGEWDFNLDWKPVQSWPVYAGWLRAIRIGHARLHAGLDVPCPALVLCSDKSAHPTEMTEEVHRSDIVLDVAQIRQWAPAVGRHVTVVAVEDARHDVVLSLPEVRKGVYDELDRWVSAYVD